MALLKPNTNPVKHYSTLEMLQIPFLLFNFLSLQGTEILFPTTGSHVVIPFPGITRSGGISGFVQYFCAFPSPMLFLFKNKSLQFTKKDFDFGITTEPTNCKLTT